MRYSRVFTFDVLLLFELTAISQNLPQGAQRVTSVEGITEYRFASGLELLLFPDNSKPTVTVNHLSGRLAT
jgi:zinc protease